jgi:uncharacterized protein YjdB
MQLLSTANSSNQADSEKTRALSGWLPRTLVGLFGGFMLTFAAPADAASSTIAFNVTAHIQDAGNLTGAADQWIGSKGSSKRLESFSIQPLRPSSGNWPTCLNIEYMAHVQDTGDTSWTQGPNLVGTAGQKRRIEGLAMRLTGTCATQYTVEYRCHLQDLGDSALMKNGEFCGTRGQKRRLEAFQVTVRKR